MEEKALPTIEQQDVGGSRAAGVFRRRFMLYVYIPFVVVYMEILLRLLCGYDFWTGLHVAVLFTVSVGLVINAISLINANPKISRAVAASLLGILCFLYALEYFMFSTYKVFMDFDTILFGMGHVVDEFGQTLITVIFSGIPIIIAFFLPLAVFLILARNPKKAKQTRFARFRIPFTAGDKKERIRYIAKLAAVFGIALVSQIIILSVSENDGAAYRSEYNFDSSSRRLGILMGVSLDLRYGIFGNPATDAFFVVDDLPPEAWASSGPSQPAVTSPQITPWNGSSDLATPSSIIDPDPPSPIEYGYNTLDIDFDTLIANEGNTRIKAINEYIASLSGSKKSEYTGIFEGKNLIILTAEAFSKEAVDPVMTPTLYRLVHNGFYFSDYYQPAWGGSTSSGEYSVLTGLAPVQGARSILMAARQNMSYTIGNKLMKQGYFSVSYHNGSHTYYNRDRTHTYLGYSSFIAWGSGMEGKVQIQWPISDLEMMEFSVPHYIDNQPFSVYYMTVSGHATYSRYYNAMSAKNWDAFPEQYALLSNTIRAYMACNLELEYALEFLVTALEDAGILDDTVIALSTDHYPYGLEHSEAWGTDRDYLSELFGYRVVTPADRDHSALIIWSGSLENEHKDLAIEVSSPTFSLDILPTLLNLFGLEFDSRLFAGRDVFSDAAPLVFWLDRSFKTDLGFYHAPRGVFTPSMDVEVSDEYIDWVRSVVNNRINYSDAVTAYDYFNVLFYEDGTVRAPG